MVKPGHVAAPDHPARTNRNSFRSVTNPNSKPPRRNGIRKTKAQKKKAVSPRIEREVLPELMDEDARRAIWEPMSLVTKKDAEADDMKEQYRQHYAIFEEWRSDPELRSFCDPEAIAKEHKKLKEILDDMELHDLNNPREVRLADCW